MLNFSRLFALAAAIACLAAAAIPARALDDTPQSRAQQADRYLATTPPKAMFDDMSEKMAASLPADQRAGFRNLMTRHMDITALTKAMRASLIKNFTTDELAALADFYASPVGKSAMAKMGVYMADMMPVMQAEIGKALNAAQKETQQKK